jgi:hypothetical protein
MDKDIYAVDERHTKQGREKVRDSRGIKQGQYLDATLGLIRLSLL